jgi:hypothetical protein
MPARWNRPVFLLRFFEDKLKRITWTEHGPLGPIGAMTSASQRSGLEFRFERGVSLGLKSFIARLDEFRTGVAL